jgi:hypothetical protein
MILLTILIGASLLSLTVIVPACMLSSQISQLEDELHSAHSSPRASSEYAA